MEIGRFSYGNFMCSNGLTKDHSSTAYSLIDKMTIFELFNQLKPKLFIPLKEGANSETDIWRITERTDINSLHKEIKFSNPNFKSRSILPGFRNCGRYYAVK